jgi:hypothetical protein
MADNQAISESDVQSLATKLSEFSKTLTPGERIVLIEQLKQAPADEDVQGYQHNYYLHEKLAEMHRAELLHEAEQHRLAASGLPPRRPGVIRVAMGRMGTALVGLGTWMRQVEQSSQPVTRPL